MRTALYPGSFDPVTVGHMDVIVRAAAQFDRVIVGILHNPGKPSGTFSIEERIALLEKAVKGLEGVTVKAYAGLLVDAARKAGADLVIRGIRTGADVEMELQMARLNRQIGGVETLFFAASPGTVHISAEMVRQIGRMGGNLQGLVPDSLVHSIGTALAKSQ